MTTTLAVSPKGQVTLPSNLRKKYGIEPGGLVNVVERDGVLALVPAVAMSVRIYSDEEIAQWAKEDEWAPGERELWKKHIRLKKTLK